MDNDVPVINEPVASPSDVDSAVSKVMDICNEDIILMLS